MHGREGEERSKHLGHPPHMRAAPSRLGAARDSDGSLSSPASSSQSFFCKDGRKISVGDSALFKLPQDSPPSIGFICRVTVTKDNNLKLGVNWLYRPTEVELGKGILLEAAPNEIFYSFKKDEISAASLLHPCKVAFLPKGVELPPGVSSFVCRRVYDIANRRLWWLTDKCHFNEEIDQLLYKTRIEMHASPQPNGRSPRQMSGPMSSSQLKPGADSLQRTASLPSQSKGKKRERPDQSTDLVRRERSSKAGDGDSGRSSSESLLKSEIAKIVEKGPLVDTEGVDRLVQVMYFEIKERKIDLSARAMLTSIIVATERPDCLSRFVQTKGLSILDDWLQDVHKGKTGDSGSLKDNDKVAEEFLLVLLRALDKLPVNLLALQMCNIGKSVNHLRTHKSVEIQKKARSLVDTWKKRVEAEMNINDAKIGSNQAGSGSARSRLPEVSHVNRNSGGSSEGAPKSPSVQVSSSKTALPKLPQGETAKPASQFQGPAKSASPQASAGVNMKDGLPHIGSSSSDGPLTTSRDEKSSSSSPSNNSSLSCSGDHVKNGGSAVKEDTRSSGSLSKMPSSASRQRKPANGFAASVASGRETGPSRTVSMHRNVAPDKASQSGLTSEKAADVAPEVNSHKFIVRIPSRRGSPAQRVAGGAIEDSSAMTSRPSSPMPLDRPDQLDAVMEERAGASQANASLDANAESSQGNDLGDSLDARDGPVDPSPSEEHLNADENTEKTLVVSKSSISPPRNSFMLGKVPDAYMSPMNALIESCVNHAKANAPVLIGDDVGMHLLASVAAGEMVKSEVASPADYPHGTPSSVDPSCRADDSERKLSPLDSHSRENDLPKAVGSDCTQKDCLEGSALASSIEDGKDSLLGASEKLVGEEDRLKNSFCADVDRLVVPSPGSNKVSNELAGDASDAGMDLYSEGSRQSKKEVALEGPCLDELQDAKANIDSSISPVNKLKDEIAGMKSETEAEVGPISDGEGRNTGNNSDNCEQVEAKPSGRILSAETNARELKTADRLREAAVSEMQAVNKIKQSGTPETSKLLEVQKIAGPGSSIEKQAEREPVSEKMVSGPLAKPERDLPLQDLDVREKSRRCDVPSGKEGDEMKECNSSSALASIAGSLERDARLEFDLNEGFSTDEGKIGESMNFKATTSPAVTVPVVGPLTGPPSSSSASLSAPIAVSAAAAKGPFVPQDDLLRAKVEIGWKGSAATSAFRPAEPRKYQGMPTNTASTTHSPDASLGKQSRPPLDFDLNVADERITLDAAPQSSSLGMVSFHNFRSDIEKADHEVAGTAPTRGSGGLGLDLNCADEVSTDGGNFSIRSGQKADAGVRRDFDLNDEPVMDASEPSISGQQQLRSSVLAHHLPLSGLRVKGAEMGNFSSWFHAGSSYSAVPFPSILADRGEQSFPIVAAAGAPPRMTGPSAGGIQFNPEIYRGPVLSSSPGLPFPSAPFQYSVFPYGTSFPLPSATLSGSPTTYIDPLSGGRLGFPPAHSQLLGPAGAVASHFPRPYIVNLSDGSGNGIVESGKKWSRQGLDLNTGPGGLELEGRDETSPLGPRQLSIGGPQNLAEEQARMYQMSSGLLKRKEPEGGWDGYRQSPWHQ